MPSKCWVGRCQSWVLKVGTSVNDIPETLSQKFYAPSKAPQPQGAAKIPLEQQQQPLPDICPHAFGRPGNFLWTLAAGQE